MFRIALCMSATSLLCGWLMGMPGEKDLSRNGAMPGENNQSLTKGTAPSAETPPTEADSIPGTSLKFAGFPVLGYTPETRIMGGIYTHLLMGDPGNLRPSSVGMGLLLSGNRQFSVNLLPEFWWKNNRFRLTGELKGQYWPDRYYGIGNDTHEENRELYTSRVWGIKLDLMNLLRNHLYGGILLEIENNRIVGYDTSVNAILPGGSVPGSDHSRISGLGSGLAWDSRSDILLPSSGAYCQFRLVFFNQAMGSTLNYTKWIIDLRGYREIGNEHLLYLQLYGKFLWGKEIPFRNMALLGGDRFLRGYFKGRYRDHNMFLAQAEYHSPPLWRFSFVAFAGVGDVFHSASTMHDIRIKPAGGIGLRWRVFKDRRMNIRLDMAAGRGDRGMYLGILEAF